MDASNITENNITTQIGGVHDYYAHQYKMELISIQKRGIKGENKQK